MTAATVRSQFVLLFYALAGLYSFIPSSFGPLIPYLRAEMHISYTVTAFHFSALALGVIASGTVGDKVIRKLGRHASLWLGIGGVAAGASLFVIGGTPIVTIAGALLIGVFGSIMGQTIDTVIAERLGEARTIAITEINVVNSTCASLAPAVVSLFVKNGLNWRCPLAAGICAIIIAYFLLRNVQVPERIESKHKVVRGKLSTAYWCYWLVILLGCASEWSIVYWCADFLENVLHLQRADAAAAVSAFFVAMLVSRVIGTRLARIISTRVMLPICAAVGMCGFAIFWLTRMPLLNIAGLFIAGFGIANLYPLTLSSALGLDPEISSVAASRMNIATGSAGLFGPLLLGCMADRVGISGAYTVVAIFLSLSLIMILSAGEAARRRVAVPVVVDK